MKRIVSVLLITALLATLFASCSSGGEGGSFVYPLSASPSTLDPQFCSGTDAETIINNCFEGLTRKGPGGEITQGVAKSWEVSADGLTYTFSLRDDSEWYRIGDFKKVLGEDLYDVFATKKVNAYDFVFAFRRAVEAQTASPWASQFFVIKNAAAINAGKLAANKLGAVATDEFTLVITLENPCVDFLERLTLSAFMPCNELFFNATGGRYGLSHKYLLCNGPFYIKMWDNESKIVMGKSSCYKGAYEALPSALTFVFEPNPRVVAEKTASGAYSACVLTPYYVPESKDLTFTPIEDTVYGFCFNCKDYYFSNVNLRLGLCCSIDRGTFPQVNGMGERCSGIVPPCCTAGSVKYREAVGKNNAALPYDPAKAVEHWNKGLEEMKVDTVKVIIICDEKFDEAVRRQIQIWQQLFGISISVAVENYAEGDVAGKMQLCDYQLAFGPVSAQSQTVSGFFNSFKSDAAENVFAYSDALYDAAADKIPSCNTQAESLNCCFTAESMLLQNGVFCPIFEYPSYFIQAEGVSGVACSYSGDRVCFIWSKKDD